MNGIGEIVAEVIFKEEYRNTKIQNIPAKPCDLNNISGKENGFYPIANRFKLPLYREQDKTIGSMTCFDYSGISLQGV